MSNSVGAPAGTRYAVSRADSWMTFEARSTLHPVRGKTTDLDGYVEASWTADGSLAAQPPPKMHVDFPVEKLSSGNGMQDREMWKLVDSRRFPRAAADLRDLVPASTPERYVAAGDVTLVGRARRYDGELTMHRDGDAVTVDGELDIDIRDFGLKPPNLLIMKVDPIVHVRLHLVVRAA